MVKRKLSVAAERAFKACIFKPSKREEAILNKDILKVLHKGGTLNQAIFKIVKNPKLMSPSIRDSVRRGTEQSLSCMKRVVNREMKRRA